MGRDYRFECDLCGATEEIDGSEHGWHNWSDRGQFFNLPLNGAYLQIKLSDDGYACGECWELLDAAVRPVLTDRDRINWEFKDLKDRNDEIRKEMA